MLRLTLAALHLLALGIGFGAVWARARALTAAAAPPGALRLDALRVAFTADNWWGLAALLWIGTGLWRALASTEKSTAYYAHNVVFWTKMGLLVTLLVVEAWPMVTLIRWRVAAARGATGGAAVGDPARARLIARISYGEVALLALMVGSAVAMARGYGSR